MNLIATIKDNVKAFDMKTPFLIFSATLFCFAFSKNSKACSSMTSPLAWDAGFAHNFDWDTVLADVEGGFTINQRGVRKKGVLFGATKNLADWTSRYASVSFSVTGPEYPASGINEKGLFIITQALDETEWPDLKDSRPALNTTQFVQYHLDRSETIDDVIASDQSIRPFSMAFKVHYFVCDSSRDCAVIQYINGKMLVYKGQNLPYSVLTNNLYPESVRSVDSCSKAGCTEKSNSLWRFAELAYKWKNSNTKEDVSVGFWPWLDQVQQLPTTSVATRFQVVYDPHQRMIYAKHWKTKKLMFFSYDFKAQDCNKASFGLEENYLEVDPFFQEDVTSKFHRLSLGRRADLAVKAGMPQLRAQEMAEAGLHFTCEN